MRFLFFCLFVLIWPKTGQPQPIRRKRLLLGDLGKDLAISEKQVLLLTNLDGGAAKGGQEDTVTGLDRGLDKVASANIGDTGANGKNISLVELLSVLLGDVDTRSGLGLGLQTLHKDAVEQGDDGLDVLDGRLERAVSIMFSGCKNELRRTNSKTALVWRPLASRNDLPLLYMCVWMERVDN